MTATRVDLHGVVTEASLPPWEDALRSLLSFFDETSEAPSLTITARSVSASGTEPFGPRWKPTFFFGVMQGFLRDDGLAYGLSDARSRGTIDAVGGRVTLEVSLREDGTSAPTTSGMSHAALCLALRERSLFELHAAGVIDGADGNSARLIIGNAGSGKTSTALSMIAAGCRFLGDDRVLLRARPGAARAPIELCAYPRTFHVPLATAAALPAVFAHARASDGIGGKLSLSPRLAFASAFCARWAGPVSLLLPRVAHCPRTEIARAAPADAFGALLESSALALVDGIRHRDQNLALLAALANAAPAFRVHLGRDALDRPAEVARRILDETRP